MWKRLINNNNNNHLLLQWYDDQNLYIKEKCHLYFVKPLPKKKKDKKLFDNDQLQ